MLTDDRYSASERDSIPTVEFMWLATLGRLHLDPVQTGGGAPPALDLNDFADLVVAAGAAF